MLFVLFVAVAIAVLVQTLSVVIICAERAREAESDGRSLFAEKQEALAAVRSALLGAWGPIPWGDGSDAGGVRSTAAEVPESGGWVMEVTAAHPADVSPVTVSAWVERGRDGIDLPLAGIVADEATWPAGRTAPVLRPEAEGSDDGGPARPAMWLRQVAATIPVAPGLQIGQMPAPWRLDGGWRSLFEHELSPEGGGVGSGARVTVLRGAEGSWVSLPEDVGGSEGEWALVVVVGGASLDARGRGDVNAVIVVDGGGSDLEGTCLHGALFVTGTAAFGDSGSVCFVPNAVRWASDESLVRTRLVPGSREESVE